MRETETERERKDDKDMECKRWLIEQDPFLTMQDAQAQTQHQPGV